MMMMMIEIDDDEDDEDECHFLKNKNISVSFSLGRGPIQRTVPSASIHSWLAMIAYHHLIHLTYQLTSHLHPPKFNIGRRSCTFGDCLILTS